MRIGTPQLPERSTFKMIYTDADGIFREATSLDWNEDDLVLFAADSVGDAGTISISAGSVEAVDSALGDGGDLTLSAGNGSSFSEVSLEGEDIGLVVPLGNGGSVTISAGDGINSGFGSAGMGIANGGNISLSPGLGDGPTGIDGIVDVDGKMVISPTSPIADGC